MASFCWFVQLPDRTSILLEGVSFHSLSFSVPPAQPVVSLQKERRPFCQKGRRRAGCIFALGARHSGKTAVICRDRSSWVAAVILPLWALTMADAMERPSP